MYVGYVEGVKGEKIKVSHERHDGCEGRTPHIINQPTARRKVGWLVRNSTAFTFQST